MKTNFLIIGSGISGLNFALQAAKKGQVLIVTKKKIIDSSTNFAQGGIAAVLDTADNFEKHVEDTLKAGAYHNDKRAVKFMVRKSAAAIYRLIDLGVEFENKKGELKLTKEGGHGHRRIAYVGDYTGQEIEKILVKRVKEHPNITIIENAFALELIVKNKRCFGAQIIHQNKIENIFADQSILATGGIGQLFKFTTNPSIATGDGIAMGIRAGCKIKDIEFIQFHPTALAKNSSPMFLLSEALRGEGAKLINSKGKRFTSELAPRDIVARDIYQEQKKGPVYLDMSHKKANALQKRFPQIYKKLQGYNLDLAKDKIPVTPAAHYECGGIKTDLQGKTGIKNLFAFGEVTCTGVHGANRLASNSLLEALVFSNQIEKLLNSTKTKAPTEYKKENLLATSSKESQIAKKLKLKIKNLMWEYAGIIRLAQEIKNKAIPKITAINDELNKIKGTNVHIAEAKNMSLVSMAILKAALKRKKSLGCHFVN